MADAEKTRIAGVDIGGTFTDMITIDLNSKKKFIKKVPSTPSDPSIAFMNSLEIQDLSTIKRIIHGTTHATNTIITRMGATVGVITTRGFRDVIEIMRCNRPYDNVYNLQWVKNKHLVPRYLRVEVEERIDYKGDEIEPLDEDGVINATEFIVNHGVTSIAICFLFSYMNPSHEERAQELIKRKFPNIFISTSANIVPEWREYERFSTTVCDAYVKPRISQYTSNIERKLKEKSYFSDLLIMKSNGGVMSSKIACKYPISTCLSGPAAGVVGGKYFAIKAGFKNLITTDMGGTSFDVGLIHGGDYGYTTETEITEGIPIKVPMIDIRTIGAGGGSIAWIDSGGALRVGPKSAGAEPGPACYDTGGTQPTVTDANLVLGRLNPKYFLGGERILNKKLAENVISNLSKKLGINYIETANGIITKTVANMVQEIRSITTENGYDPRDFALMAAGGAGPLHGALISRELKIKNVLIPPFPGLMSAIGLLLSDLKFDSVKTYHVLFDPHEIGEISIILNEMLDENIGLLRSEGFKDKPICITSLDMRYLGQNYEINLVINKDRFEFNDVCQSFDKEHKRLYGITLPGIPREVLRLRTSVIGIIGDKFEVLDSLAVRDGMTDRGKKPSEICKEKRLIYEDSTQEPVECLIFERNTLFSGFKLEGPAIIEELDSTIYVPSKSEMRVDDFGNIILIN